MSPQQPRMMDVLKLLERSNCGECGLPTCLAFASQVSMGERALGDCPRLDPDVVARHAPRLSPQGAAQGDELDPRSVIPRLRERMRGVDLKEAAERLGVERAGERLSIRVLGRVFEVDAGGGLHTLCHVNHWVHLPLLLLVLDGRGLRPTGAWTTFNELPGTRDWVRFFDYKCAQAFSRLADEHPALFADLLDLFADRRPSPGPDADWVKTLWPLPRVPIRFCFWAAEGAFPAKLTVLFDQTAGDNLGAEGLFQLCRGLLEMFQKIVTHHAG